MHGDGGREVMLCDRGERHRRKILPTCQDGTMIPHEFEILGVLPFSTHQGMGSIFKDLIERPIPES